MMSQGDGKHEGFPGKEFHMKRLKYHPCRLLPVGIVTLFLMSAGSTFAQYQVSQPGEAGPNGPGSDPNAVNSPTRLPGIELYGNNNREKPVRYPPQTEYLPSEILLATQRSGATPSEIRTQADAIGPLSPNGRADFIPLLSPLQRAMGVTPPVLFGPAWQTRPVVTYNGKAPTPELNVTPPQPGTNAPGVNRSQVEPSPLDVTPKPVNPMQPLGGQMITAQPLGPVTVVNITVNRPLVRTHPATQPATTQPAPQPSLEKTVRPIGE
jgi:hypothetical protein